VAVPVSQTIIIGLALRPLYECTRQLAFGYNVAIYEVVVGLGYFSLLLQTVVKYISKTKLIIYKLKKLSTIC